MLVFEADPSATPRRNQGVRNRWARYRAAQRFRVKTIQPDGQEVEIYLKTYEAVARHLGLTISTVRRLFSNHGGSFTRLVGGNQTEVTRGKAIHVR